jgi:hypothetical protein
MRQMILSLMLTAEEEVLWKDRHAVVIPATDQESLTCGADVIVVHEGQIVLADALHAYMDGRAEQGRGLDAETCIALADIALQLHQCAERQARVREFVGRAVFIGPAKEKGTMQ